MKLERSKEWWMKKAHNEAAADELVAAQNRIADLNRYIKELEDGAQYDNERAERLVSLLREAGRYVADANADKALMARILTEIDPTATAPR